MTDVAIIGGGIVGTATAAFLAERGVRVTLFERAADVAAGASGRNAGEVCHPPDPVLGSLYGESFAAYQRLEGERLAPGEVFRLGAGPIGVLEVAADGDLVRRVAASIASAQPDLAPEVVDGAALAALEPLLAPGLTALRIETGHPVRPADATRAFATLARRRGAIIRTGAAASVWTEEGVARGVIVGGERVAARSVVVAAGPWTPSIVDPSGSWRPIHASWGVIVEMSLDPAPRHVMGEIRANGSVLLAGRPPEDAPDAAGPVDAPPEPVLGINPGPVRSDGTLVPTGLGGTLSPREPDAVRVAPTLVTHARQFLPSLDPSQMGALRTCARPQSLDGRPLIGHVPGIARLVVAAGNGAWGISTGPATARLAADAALSGTDDGVQTALRADRFGGPPSAG